MCSLGQVNQSSYFKFRGCCEDHWEYVNFQGQSWSSVNKYRPRCCYWDCFWGEGIGLGENGLETAPPLERGLPWMQPVRPLLRTSSSRQPKTRNWPWRANSQPAGPLPNGRPGESPGAFSAPRPATAYQSNTDLTRCSFVVLTFIHLRLST